MTDGEEKTYGGCEGPDAMYVKLISSDGHEFIVKREHALTSGTIKAMLSGPGMDAEWLSSQKGFIVTCTSPQRATVNSETLVTWQVTVRTINIFKRHNIRHNNTIYITKIFQI